MPKERMRDLIVLIPGIMGSVLQKGDRDIWALSRQAIWSAVKSLGGSTEQLKLENDDIKADILEDGIKATRLISDVCIIPGFVKIDGYTGISQMIKRQFDVITGSETDKSPANYFEFPYDWRRDCRAAALKLENLINYRLPQWREYSGYDDAKVILLGHSMGGLVSRHYLEMLDGWKCCKALITFGTPYRGSLNAVNFLANGYKKLFLDFTEILRSMTGVYQLLPTYKVLRDEGTYKRIADIENIPNIDSKRANAALTFHHDIEAAVTEHRKDVNYWENGYKIFPMVGIHQPSFQSAELVGEQITVSTDLPPNVDNALANGDGTVPMLSAIPPELGNEYRDSFYSGRHASLQNNAEVLTYIFDRLKRMQIEMKLQGSQGLFGLQERPVLSIDLDDLFLNDEPVSIQGRLLNVKGGRMKATVEALDGAFRQEYTFADLGNRFLLEIEGLPSGAYRVEASAEKTDGTLEPVTDLFQIA